MPSQSQCWSKRLPSHKRDYGADGKALKKEISKAVPLTSQCKNCRKGFVKNNNNQKYCSSNCAKQYRRYRRATEQKERLRRKDAAMAQVAERFAVRQECMSESKNVYKDFVSKKGYYRKNLEQYKDKIIDCPDSPSGKAYIGIAKKPLMKVEDGHGYQGVVLQDETRRYVQCHACGKWMKKNSIYHLRKCGFQSDRDYKEKYGLNYSEGLVSDETSLRLTKACLKNKSAKRMFAKTNEKVKNGEIKVTKGSKDNKHSMQYKNLHGSCPAQIKARLYEFIHCNRELPSQGNKGRSLYKLLVRRHGSYGEGLKAHGLPHFKRKGTNMIYTFPDHTVYKYNINQFYEREALYNMMLQKCPVLTENNGS